MVKHQLLHVIVVCARWKGLVGIFVLMATWKGRVELGVAAWKVAKVFQKERMDLCCFGVVVC